jgi:hypothetical protein
MICLSDNDIIKKLAICNLLDEMLAVLEAGHGDVRVLPSAKFVLGIAKQPEKARARYGSAVFDRLADFLGKVRELSAPPSPEEQLLFDDAIGIDPGEAVLFSATAEYTDFLLATGDKRSLRALVGLPAPNAVMARLVGRVICFEQILVRVMKLYGFDHLLDRAVPAVDCDTVLRAIFGSGLDAVETNVRGSFDAYIRHLRGETGSLLIDA